MRIQNTKNLYYDDSKLQSYIDNALVPMVNGLKDHPALMAWEVINEPEGMKKYCIAFATYSKLWNEL